MPAMPNQPDVALPLTHSIYHILLVLAAGERHGYALRQEITVRTSGMMRVGNGTLYRSIETMLATGLIDEEFTSRRIFRLTALGEQTAWAETERLVRLVALARRTPRLAEHLS